jgi:parallel beta-helix repeat protein
MFKGKKPPGGGFSEPWGVLCTMTLAGLVFFCLCGCGGIDPSAPLPGVDRGVDSVPRDRAPNSPSSVTTNKPSIAVTVEPVYCCNPRSMVLEAQVSNLPNHESISFRWEFGDGRTGEGARLEHTYGWPGEYTIILQAELPDGTTVLAQHELVLPGEAVPPEEEPTDDPTEEPAVAEPTIPDEPDVYVPEPPPVEDPNGIPGEEQPTGQLTVNQDAIDLVLDGLLTTANAGWWGFDENDATNSIQSAINSGAKIVIIPNVGKDWIVRPLFLVSNQEVIFENGVVLTAKLGAFRGMHDCLLSADGVNNVILRGYNAVLRMRKADYMSSAYSVSEFRHVLFLQKVRNIQVLGLSFQSSGGDGIYIGPVDDFARTPPRDILIKDCDCFDNYRQGISVLSAENLTIENCTFRNTSGTAPQAGIDLEPDYPKDVLINVRLINCAALGNSGSGFLANLSYMDATSRPISVTVQNMLIQGSHQPGLRAVIAENGPPGGFIEFRDSLIEVTEYSGLGIKWNLTTAIELRFLNCEWRRVARLSPQFPFLLKFTGSRSLGAPGGIRFDNCYIDDQQVRHTIKIDNTEVVSGAADMTGTIFVTNPSIDEPIPTTTWPFPDLDVLLVP